MISRRDGHVYTIELVFDIKKTPCCRETSANPMIHPWHDVTPGEHLPSEFNALVEIPMGSSVKYELDKKTGLLRLDRIFIRRSITRRITGSSPRRMPRTMIRSTCWCSARSRSRR